MLNQDRDARKFARAAAQRLTAAELLLSHGHGLDATYLAGYAVECALKSLILKRTPKSKLLKMVGMITRGARGHDLEYLKGVLRSPPVSCAIPTNIGERLSRVATWSTDLRYEVGLLPYEDANAFVDAAKDIMNWVRRS